MASRVSAHLEKSRLNLRARFHSKFSPHQSKPRANLAPPSPVAAGVQKHRYLEQARRRLQDNYEKYLAMLPDNYNMTNGHSNVIYNWGDFADAPQTPTHMDMARKRLHERFRRKFLPNFDDFPKTLDDAVYAMYQDEWGQSNAVVVTSASPPYQILKVNQCWENLCGWKEDEVRGKTFGSLGIQGSFTGNSDIDQLHNSLALGKSAAVRLVNKNKWGEIFPNYLRVAPLKDPETDEITSFIGVLQNEDFFSRKISAKL